MEENIKLKKIEAKDKSILQNLFQLYMHDITASLPMDVNEHGLFEYNYIDYYFTEESRYAYLIYVEENIAGFVLIDDEFMVLDKENDKPSTSPVDFISGPSCVSTSVSFSKENTGTLTHV